MSRTYRNIDGYRLSVPLVWDSLGAEDLRRLCNGVGPDSWPARRRAAIGHLLPWMIPASKPHDVRYALIAARLRAGLITPRQAAKLRLTADKELLRNWLTTIAKDLRWHWWRWLTPCPSPRRAAYLAQCAFARLAYRAVRIAGAQFACPSDHAPIALETPPA